MDRILPFFDPPPCVDRFYTQSVDKNIHFLPPPSVVVEWPLILDAKHEETIGRRTIFFPLHPKVPNASWKYGTLKKNLVCSRQFFHNWCYKLGLSQCISHFYRNILPQCFISFGQCLWCWQDSICFYIPIYTCWKIINCSACYIT